MLNDNLYRRILRDENKNDAQENNNDINTSRASGDGGALLLQGRG
jgi:hypothetical protein